MAVDYKVFISSVEDILRDHGLQHDSEGNSVTEKIFFDVLVYRAVCQSADLQLQIRNHLVSQRERFYQTDQDFTDRYGNADTFLNDRELIQNIDKECTPADNVWTRFSSAFEKMKSTWEPIFSAEFYLQKIPNESLQVQKAFELVVRKFQDIQVRIGDQDKEKPLDAKTLEMDDIGDIFEYFLSCRQEKRANSRALGQYFTPLPLIKKVVSLMDLEPGSSVLDYACGSGGFLVGALRKQRDLRLLGCEISSSPYRLAILNVFFASNFTVPDMNQAIVKENAFHFVPRMKHQVDYVLANPPFGINVNIYNKTHRIESRPETAVFNGKRKRDAGVDQLEWKSCPDVTCPVEVKLRKPSVNMQRQERCEFSDSEGLFLSLSVSALKPGGRAAIVFSLGLLTTEQNDFYRLLLLRECMIDVIYVVPRGVFKNTGVETCVIVFTKKPPAGDYDIPFRDIQTDNHLFSLQSSAVCADARCRLFLGGSTNTERGIGCPVLVLPGAALDAKEEFSSFALRDVCSIKNGERVTLAQLQGRSAETLLYRAYGSGQQFHMIDRFNRPDRSCKVGRFGLSPGTCVMFVDGPFFCKDSAFTVTSSTPKLLNEYLWYWLWYHKERVYNCSEGKCQRGMNMTRFGDLTIMVPETLQVQRELIDLLETYYLSEHEKRLFLQLHFTGISLSEANSKMEYIRVLQRHKESMENIILESAKLQLLRVYLLMDESDSQEFSLSELCLARSGQSLARDQITPGCFPVIGGGQRPIAHHENYNCPAGAILCSTSGSAGFISRYDTPVWASDCFYLQIKESMRGKVSERFLYLYLKAHQEKIYQLRRIGRGPIHMSPSDLLGLRVKLPPMHLQEISLAEIDQTEAQNAVMQRQIETTDRILRLFLEGKDDQNLRNLVASRVQTRSVTSKNPTT